MRQLELALLDIFGYNVKVTASDYAKVVLFTFTSPFEGNIISPSFFASIIFILEAIAFGWGYSMRA